MEDRAFNRLMVHLQKTRGDALKEAARAYSEDMASFYRYERTVNVLLMICIGITIFCAIGVGVLILWH